jgi:hypothetical protein
LDMGVLAVCVRLLVCVSCVFVSMLGVRVCVCCVRACSCMNERTSSSCMRMTCVAKARRGRQMSCGHGTAVPDKLTCKLPPPPVRNREPLYETFLLFHVCKAANL